MPRIVHHKLKVLNKLTIAAIDLTSLIRFDYTRSDGTRNKKRPVIFVFERKGKYVKGININYLDPFKVKWLLGERGNLKEVSREIQKFRWYELYEDSIRTYLIKRMSNVFSVDWIEGKDAIDANKFEL